MSRGDDFGVSDVRRVASDDRVEASSARIVLTEEEAIAQVESLLYEKLVKRCERLNTLFPIESHLFQDLAIIVKKYQDATDAALIAVIKAELQNFITRLNSLLEQRKQLSAFKKLEFVHAAAQRHLKKLAESLEFPDVERLPHSHAPALFAGSGVFEVKADGDHAFAPFTTTKDDLKPMIVARPKLAPIYALDSFLSWLELGHLDAALVENNYARLTELKKGSALALLQSVPLDPDKTELMFDGLKRDAMLELTPTTFNMLVAMHQEAVKKTYIGYTQKKPARLLAPDKTSTYCISPEQPFPWERKAYAQVHQAVTAGQLPRLLPGDDENIRRQKFQAYFTHPAVKENSAGALDEARKILGSSSHHLAPDTLTLARFSQGIFQARPDDNPDGTLRPISLREAAHDITSSLYGYLQGDTSKVALFSDRVSRALEITAFCHQGRTNGRHGDELDRNEKALIEGLDVEALTDLSVGHYFRLNKTIGVPDYIRGKIFEQFLRGILDQLKAQNNTLVRMQLFQQILEINHLHSNDDFNESIWQEVKGQLFNLQRSTDPLEWVVKVNSLHAAVKFAHESQLFKQDTKYTGFTAGQLKQLQTILDYHRKLPQGDERRALEMFLRNLSWRKNPDVRDEVSEGKKQLANDILQLKHYLSAEIIRHSQNGSERKLAICQAISIELTRAMQGPNDYTSLLQTAQKTLVKLAAVAHHHNHSFLDKLRRKATTTGWDYLVSINFNHSEIRNILDALSTTSRARWEALATGATCEVYQTACPSFNALSKQSPPSPRVPPEPGLSILIHRS